jgi:hypothetical protein
MYYIMPVERRSRLSLTLPRRCAAKEGKGERKAVMSNWASRVLLGIILVAAAAFIWWITTHWPATPGGGDRTGLSQRQIAAAVGAGLGTVNR